MKGKALKLLSLVLVVILALTCFFACKDDEPTPKPDDNGGNVTPTPTPTPTPEQKDYVEIADEATLLEVAGKIAANTDGYATKTFKLTADIVLTKDFAPITGFSGVFDGQFHTISGLNIDSDLAEVGLFSTLKNATVRNLTVVATGVANANPEANIGILAGSAENSAISCVTVDGTLTLGGSRAVAGGVVALVKNTTILNVKSTATLAGAGSVAGGVVAKLDEGAMLVNAYSAATVSATAATKAAAVAEKVTDSAVAYVLVKEGAVVGVAEASEFLPDYIIGCKTGAAASEMGWNTVDWDVSGEAPALKADLNKTHAAPVVTLDGVALTAVYGEKLIVSAPTLTAGQAFVGYAVAGTAYYQALPVVNDLALTTVTVDYEALLGTWTALSASDDALTVAETLSFGTTSLTYVTATVADGVPTLYFADAEGALYRLSVKTLSAAEKSSLGYTVDGAALLALEKKNGNGYDAAKFYMPAPGAAVGAWTIDGKVTIYTSDLVANGTQNAYRSMTVGVSVGTYKTCLTVKDGAISVLADGAAVGTDADGAPVLTKNGATLALAVDALDGEWIGNGTKLTISNGKIGDTTLKAVSTVYGSGLLNEADNTLYIVTFSGIVAIKDGQSVLLANGDFSGDWKTVIDGVTTTVTIVGDQVYVNGAADAVTATITPDAATGVAKLTVAIGDKTYAFVHDGIMLVADDLTLYTASAVNALYGSYVLGSTSFVLSDGKLVIVKAGVAGTAQNLTLVYADEILTFVAGDLTFAPVNDRMTVTGYVSEVTGKTDTLNLFSAAELATVIAALKGDWMARSTGGVKYASLKMSFTADGVLSFDGKTSAYEFGFDSNGAIVLNAKCLYEGKVGQITVTPRANGLLSTNGVGVGAMMPEALAESVGKYYEFLTGSGEEGEIPSYIYFYYDGKLSLNIVKNGTVTKTDYPITAYEIATNGLTYVLTVIDPETKEVVVTVTFGGNKTLVFNNTTYTNVDFLIPKNTYHEVGKTSGISFDVITGSVGYYEHDEDEDEDIWYDAVYPLYGFRYTDAAGKVYTSVDFSWAKVNGVHTVTARVKASDDETLTLTITYPDGHDFSKLSVKVGDAEAIDVYSESMIANDISGSYENKEHSFSVSKAGVLTLNGEKKEFTYVRNGDIVTYTVDGVDYVIDLKTPEILKCGNEVYYDARFAMFAGVELKSFKRGDATADRLHTLILTDDGFFFDGVKITWTQYSKVEDNLIFTAQEMIDGAATDVVWKLENHNKSYGSFGITFYPNYSGDWNQRVFVPSILLDVGPSYVAGDTIITIKAGDYSTGSYEPFIFMLGQTRYTFADYTCSLVDGVFTVDLGDGNQLGFVKAEGVVTVTFNGATASTYTPPSLEDFEMETTQFFATTPASNKVQVVNGVITYNPNGGAYGAQIIDAYSFGKWNGLDIIYFRASGTNWAILLGENGKPVPVVAKMLDLFGTYKLDGKTVTVSFDTSTDTPAVKVKVGETDATEVKVDSKLLPADNHYYVTFTYGDAVYYIAPDLVDGGAVLADAATFNRVGQFTLASGNYLQIWLTKDTDGSAKLIYKVYRYNVVDEIVTPAPVSGKANVYSVTYGEGTTEYFALLTDAAAGYNFLAIPNDALSLLGTFTAKNGKSYVAAIGKDKDNKIAYVVTYDGQAAVIATYDATMKALKFAYNDGTTDYTCYATRSGDDLVVTEINAKQNAFVTTGSGFKTPLNTSWFTKVALVDGAPEVTFRYTKATNAYFNADNTRLYFTYDGVEYCIVMVDATQTTDYNRAVVVTAAQAAFIGTHTVDGKNLVVTVTAEYSPKLSVAYNGTTVSDVVFHSAEIMTFKGVAADNVSPCYYAAVLKDGKITLQTDFLDTTDLFYHYLGTYDDRHYTFGYKVTLNEDGTVKATYALTDSTGKALDYSINPDTLIVTVTVNGAAKYYAVCTGSTKALAELPAADVALLGSYTVDGHTVKLMANCTVKYNSWSEKYSYTTGYKLSFDNGDPMSVSFSKDNGTPEKQYVQFKAGDKTYLFFVVEAGVSAKLHELTEAQIAMIGVNYSTIESSRKYLKTNIVFADDGTFELALYFDGAAISDEADVTYGKSFKAASGETYYLINGAGVTSPYILTAAQYAWYMTDAAVGGHTITVIPGASSSNAFQVKLDGATTAVKGELVAGDYPYIKFTVDTATYILAHNTTAENALVLTQLTAEQSSALSLNISGVKLLKEDGTQYASDTFKAVVTVDAAGTVSISYTYGNNPAPTSVEVITITDTSLNIQSVVKVVIEGKTTYLILHGRYKSVMTADQYALVGNWTLADGKTITIGLDPKPGDVRLMVTYDSKSVSGDDAWQSNPHTSGSALFKTVDGKTVCEFTIDGTTYQASLVDGTMTVTAVTAD